MRHSGGLSRLTSLSCEPPERRSNRL
jgi:hypothetical protein